MRPRHIMTALFSLVLLSLAIVPHQAWAVTVVAYVEGPTGSEIRGDYPRTPGIRGTILLRGVGHNITNPTAGGLVTGRLVSQPLKVLKDFDRSSPLLFKAMVNGDLLRSVLIQFADDDPGSPGRLMVFYEIELSNSLISSITTTGGTVNPGLQELLGFTFQRMRLHDVINGTVVEYVQTAPR